MKLPTIEVRYNNLCVEAECEVVKGKPLPTLWNATKSFLLVSTYGISELCLLDCFICSELDFLFILFVFVFVFVCEISDKYYC